MKRFHGLRTVLCALLAVVFLAASAVPAMAVGQSTTLANSGGVYVVNATGVNIRSGAGTQYPVLTVATRGTQMTYLSSSKGWWYVRLSSGTVGYVDKQFLSPASASKTGNYTVIAS